MDALRCNPRHESVQVVHEDAEVRVACGSGPSSMNVVGERHAPAQQWLAR
jgi:hypothetical protein